MPPGASLARRRRTDRPPKYVDSDSGTVYTECVEGDDLALTIEQLAERTEVPVRTVRYYIAEGLLPGPGGRGKGTAYMAGHLSRLRLIRLLVERRVPLAEIRERLSALSDDEVADVLAAEERQAQEMGRAVREASPKEYVSTLLRQARAARQAPAETVTYSSAPSYASPAPLNGGSGLRSTPAEATAGATGGTIAGATGATGSTTASATSQAQERWQRITLAAGVELHVREDAGTSQERLIERLIATARR